MSGRRALDLLKQSRDLLNAEDRRRGEPIAIVGIGCRFPGGVSNPEELWRLLEQGIDATLETPPGRWDVDAYYDPDPEAIGKAYVKRGGFLERIDGFEPEFFGISPREAAGMDPQQRILLEVVWEALEDAGIPPSSLAGRTGGVWMGSCLDDYSRRSVNSGDAGRIDPYSALGSCRSVIAGRVAYILDLQGPCMQLDTACSSSLVAIHLACRSLRSGECDIAVVGGVNVISSPEATISMCKLKALAPDGRCKTFDASADGYARAEGCGVVILERLGMAQARKGTIRAVIRGTAINHDGRSNGLTAPNRRAQETVIQAALADARVDPRAVTLVETHGTGTPLGDPIEVQALSRVYGAGRNAAAPLYLGAIKTNMGHMEGAAGIAGLIKAALCLSRGKIVPNLHFKTPNPNIPWEELPVRVPTRLIDWPENGAEARAAAVSSFGISGTNAHAILEEYRPPEATLEAPTRTAELVVLSARSNDALRSSARRLRERLEGMPETRLADLSRATMLGRDPLERRLALAVPTREALLAALDATETAWTDAAAAIGGGVESKVAFVFPGQGSQWLGMGRQLLDEEPVFRDALLECDRVIAAETGWSVLAELRAEAGDSRLERIDVIQPTLFAIQIGLAALWRSWGVEPRAVVGHSMGECAAAAVAGALSLEDAAAVICRRSRLMRKLSGRGSMALVALSMKETEAELSGSRGLLSVAASNGNGSTVISGDSGELDKVLATLETRGIFCRRIKVDVASHSSQVDPILDELVSELGAIAPRTGSIPVHSTVTTALLGGPELDARYWADNLRQPVRFGQVIEALLADGFTHIVEISPHPLLVSAVEEIRQGLRARAVATGSLRRDQPERLTLLGSLGQLFVHGGLALDPARLFPEGGAPVRLPTYPWQRQSYWLDPPDAPGVSTAGALRSPPGENPPPSGESPDERAWDQELSALPPEARLAEITLAVRAEAARVLSLTAGAVPSDKPLRDLGMDSLMMQELRKALGRRTRLDLPVSLNIGSRTASAIAEYLLNALAGGAPEADEPSFEKDAILGADVSPPPGGPPPVEPTSALLTGATGFLGAFLLSELLRQTRARVTCLVRAADADAALDRVRENLRRYGLLEGASRDGLEKRVSAVAGNLEQPGLGLAPEELRALADGIDAIYCNGAHLSYVVGYEDLKASHITGTRELLRLASTGRPKSVHYVSSTSVWESSRYQGRTLTETTEPSETEGMWLPYAQCKWAAEALVRAAGARGIPVTIHRPDLIGGATSSGAANPDDLLCRFLKDMVEGWHMPDLDMRLELAPVDYIARSIIHLSRQSASYGRAFHLHHPRPIHWRELGELLRVEVIPYESWLERLKANPDGPLHPLYSYLSYRIPPRNLTHPQLHQRDHWPVLDCAETARILAAADIECPPLDRTALDRMLSYLSSSGFLKARPRTPPSR